MSFRGKSAVDELRELVAVLDRRLQQLDARVNELQVTAGSLAQRAEDRWEDIAETQRDITEALRLLHADDPGQRRRLRAARRAESYELAFTEPEPLISVVIATYDHHQLLAERALPSVLAQTYERLEVVVIGDAAPAEAEAVVRSAGDPR